jgi:hypothetical protein
MVTPISPELQVINLADISSSEKWLLKEKIAFELFSTAHYFNVIKPHNLLTPYLLTPWSRVLLEKLTSLRS